MKNYDLVGRKVRVLCSGRYKERLEERTGEITAVYSRDNVAVLIDGCHNINSAKGYFYFGINDLEFVGTEKKEENKMCKITDHLNVAVVKFLDGCCAKSYEYANFDPNLAQGDLCVVMSAHHGFGLAEVVEILPNGGEPLQREIVAKFDTATYYARVERRAKADKLKAQMQARAKQLQDISIFRLLAETDEEMRGLLHEYLNTVNHVSEMEANNEQ